MLELIKVLNARLDNQIGKPKRMKPRNDKILPFKSMEKITSELTSAQKLIKNYETEIKDLRTKEEKLTIKNLALLEHQISKINKTQEELKVKKSSLMNILHVSDKVITKKADKNDFEDTQCETLLKIVENENQKINSNQEYLNKIVENKGKIDVTELEGKIAKLEKSVENIRNTAYEQIEDEKDEFPENYKEILKNDLRKIEKEEQVFMKNIKNETAGLNSELNKLKLKYKELEFVFFL